MIAPETPLLVTRLAQLWRLVPSELPLQVALAVVLLLVRLVRPQLTALVVVVVRAVLARVARVAPVAVLRYLQRWLVVLMYSTRHGKLPLVAMSQRQSSTVVQAAAAVVVLVLLPQAAVVAAAPGSLCYVCGR